MINFGSANRLCAQNINLYSVYCFCYKEALVNAPVFRGPPTLPLQVRSCRQGSRTPWCCRRMRRWWSLPTRSLRTLCLQVGASPHQTLIASCPVFIPLPIASFLCSLHSTFFLACLKHTLKPSSSMASYPGLPSHFFFTATAAKKAARRGLGTRLHLIPCAYMPGSMCSMLVYSVYLIFMIKCHA